MKEVMTGNKDEGEDERLSPMQVKERVQCRRKVE